MVSVEVKRVLVAILFGSLLSPGLAAREAPRLAPDLMEQPVVLEFTERSVGEICDALSAAAGIRFVFDDKIDLGKRLNVDLGRMSLDRALDMLMLQTKNFYKPLDDRTVLVAPDTRQKRQEYEDQVIQTFYLTHADSRTIVTLLRSLLQTRQIAESPAQNSVTIKDTPDKAAIAARLIEAADRESGEVVVEFELLEVAQGTARAAGDAPARSIRNAPGAVHLAHPRLRIVNGQAASIHIGDSVPVPATTSCPADEQPAEPTVAMTYQNVGIEIDVVPRINDGRNVTLQLEVGISSISPEKTAAAPAGQGPVIARRKVQTTMRLADGETHVVSGLPLVGLAAVGLGRGEASDPDTELVLLVTPRVTREPRIASEDRSPLWVGTEENMRL